MSQKNRTVQEAAVNVDNDVDERMVPSKHKGSGIYGEHIARYMAATDIVKGKDVLDIASGSGYGTALLAKQAKSVVGVDISKEAIEFANKEYPAKNIAYKKSDGKTIPFADNTFDVVVSFETIEHIDDYDFFMEEIKRVLKDDGLFILSTPNELEFAEGNHFHLHEFEQDELLELAKRYYSNVEPFFQSTWIGNLIGQKAEMMKEWQREIIVQQLEPIEQRQFLYFYFLCANRPIKETVLSRYTISQHSSDRSIQEKNSLTNKHIANLEDIIEAQKKEQAKLNRLIEDYQHELNAAKSSGLRKVLRKAKAVLRKK
ncbi:MAG TPA: class I SAM-dependent methyltransferase [Candidatus Saccharimonadales bacterium]